MLGCGRGHSWGVLFDFEGLWQILDGPHRLIARPISHATYEDTVAGCNDEMLTFGVGSIAAAGHLPQRLFAALLCWQVGRGGGRLALAMLLFLAGRCRHAFHHPWMGVPDFL